jgi:hypothetical protein
MKPARMSVKKTAAPRPGLLNTPVNTGSGHSPVMKVHPLGPRLMPGSTGNGLSPERKVLRPGLPPRAGGMKMMKSWTRITAAIRKMKMKKRRTTTNPLL